MATNETQFYDNHVPVLEAGTYSISSVSQNLTVKDATTPSPSFSTSDLSFRIAAPRFVIDPSQVHSVYPPKGGKGDYQSCLPSLVLNRSTLPWERSPIHNTTTNFNPPWLYLFLVYESEKANVIENGNAPLSDITSLKIPDSTHNLINTPSNYPATFNYLEVKPALEKVFPKTLADLQYLSYARIKEGEEEKAVVLCNRLPKPGETATAYLVSLENNYTGSGSTAAFAGIKKGGNYMLPYFYKWDFHALSEKCYYIDSKVKDKIKATLEGKGMKASTFGGLTFSMDTLYPDPSSFKASLPTLPSPYNDSKTVELIEKIAELPNNTFHGVMAHLQGGIAPLNAGSTASGIAASGSVDLSYVKAIKESNGELDYIDTDAYYRSPLAASAIGVPANFPLVSKTYNGTAAWVAPTSSKELVLSNAAGKEDTTYAVAFELGRLTALNDVDYATQFVKWKTEAAVAQRLNKMSSANNYLKLAIPPSNDPGVVPSIPNTILGKVSQWSKLEGIPYRFLVPDPSLIPDESIRFFQVDNAWIMTFLCGAFSIGHTVNSDLHKGIESFFSQIPPSVSGFFINSMAVSGWPDFDLDAFDSANAPLGLISGYPMEINKNLRLYLFSGNIAQLDFYLHPTKTHSGFIYSGGKYTKVEGSGQAEQTFDCTTDIDLSVPTTTTPPNYANTIHPQEIATKIGAGNVAEFAGLMQEGVPRVIFTIS